MRRLLSSLTITLLIMMALVLPAAANAAGFSFQDDGILYVSQITSGQGQSIRLFYPADNETLPAGLTLTKGSPFVSPPEIKVGDLVTVKIKASNSGTSPINHQLTLLVNGKPVGNAQQISVAAGETKDVSFQFSAQTAGTNALTAGTLSGTFTVSGGGFFDMFPWYLWAFFGIVLAIIIMLVVLMVLKPKKRTGVQADQSRKPIKGRAGKPGKTGHSEGPYIMPQGMQRPPGMPEGMPFGQQPGMHGSQDIHMGGQPHFQGQPGMQPQFGQPPQGQPGGMQQQPGMQPQFGQPPQGQPGGMQQPSRGPQFPPSPQMPGGQSPAAGPGMQPPAGPQAAPFGMPQQQMPPPMQPQAPFGTQAPMGQGYQSMGMPKFAVSNLTITPNKVKVGEPVNISIIISNNGMQTGKYSVVLRIGGVVENISDMTLPVGASQTASFTVIKDVPGDYYADIDGLGGFFSVIPLAPPSFTVSNFTIGPERVRQGEPVTISASVTNTGEVPGSHTVILRVKGLAESQQEVTLGPGKTENIEFQVVKDTPGFYPVSVENWTGKFVVEMDWTG